MNHMMREREKKTVVQRIKASMNLVYANATMPNISRMQQKQQ